MAEKLNESPIIAAVKDESGLKACLGTSAGVVFVLYGSLLSVGDIVSRLTAAGKMPIVHVDLIDGLSGRDVAVDFIAQSTGAAGIISTKAGPVARAKALGLIAVRRYFLLDSLALESLHHQKGGEADYIEVLPGVMPKIISRVVVGTPLPVIAGGLISDKEDVVAALNAGAAAISSTNPSVWAL